MSQEERVIKKYPNRRLYDTEQSSYITLEDVKKLVLAETPIKVVDAKTGEDLTHSTLMQIIIESEAKGPSIFSTDSLQQMIRLYEGSMQQMQQMFRTMFEQNMAFLGSAPKTNNVADVAKQSMQQWQAMQQQMQKQWMQAWGGQMAPKTSSAPTPEDDANIKDNQRPYPGR